MAVKILRGALGSGKDESCIRDIERAHREAPLKKCIMLVPDHYSFETEKQFVNVFGGTGLNNIDVMTPRKLAVTFLSLSSLKYLTPSGKRMLISRSVSEYCREAPKTALTASMMKAGFTGSMESLISELKRYCIMPEDLLSSAEKTESRTLKEKLSAISAIYEKYNAFFEKGGYTDSDDDMKNVAAVIRSDPRFDRESIQVWVSRFDELLPQHMEVLNALESRGIDITISLNYPDADNAYTEETYRSVRAAYDKIKSLSESCTEEVFYDSLSYVNSPDIKFLLENRGNENAVYDGVPENITLFESLDTYSEVEHTAGEILRLVREEGLRFRDIAMINGSADEFGYIIEAVFDEYGIPYFTDEKIMLSDHPIAMQIMSVFDIFSDNWSYDAVMRYLRAGFIYNEDNKHISGEDIDRLDIFIQKYNIRGKSRWFGEPWREEKDAFERSLDDEDGQEAGESKNLEKINALKDIITAPFIALIERVKEGRTARDYAGALFKFLTDINMYEGIRNDIKYFELNDHINEAEQFSQIWNLIIEVLDQTVVTMGDMKMSFESFGNYIGEGIEKCEISTIPSGVDRVYVGSVERSASAPVKAMFIAGAVAGTFPDEMTDEGFLSNSDRDFLNNECSVTLAPNTKRLMDAQYFKVYKAVASVTDKLFLSYHIQDSAGKAVMPAGMISDIRMMFPGMRTSDNLLAKPDDRSYISSPNATIHKLLINRSRNSARVDSSEWDEVYRWFRKNGGYDKKLALIRRAEEYSYRELFIDEASARPLYEEDIEIEQDGRRIREKGSVYSASRLNTYAKCPLSYFLKYGIRARQLQTADIAANTVGTYAHRLIQEFCKSVEDGADTPEEKLERWRGLSDSDREQKIKNLSDTAKENLRSMDIYDAEKRVNVIERVQKTVINSIKAVHQSLRDGKYTTEGYELVFDKVKLADGVFSMGAIDRMDVFEDENGTHLRIIDYKTGKLGSGAEKFNVADIYDGFDMQPVIYAIAAEKLFKERNKDKKTDIAGMYYSHISDDLTESRSADEAEDAHKKTYRMDGVTFADNEGMIGAADIEAAESMKAKQAYRSEFIGINIKKDGKPGAGSIYSTEDRDALMKLVTNKIKKTDSEIKSGVIKPSPYKSGNEDVCQYCPFTEVCVFDEEKENRKKTFRGNGAENNAWNKIREEAKEKKS